MSLREQMEEFFSQDSASIDKSAALQAFHELKFFLNTVKSGRPSPLRALALPTVGF